MIWLTKFVVRSLEFAGRHFPSRKPKHLLTGKHGEIEAYFHLRALGYRIVAANFRVPLQPRGNRSDWLGRRSSVLHRGENTKRSWLCTTLNRRRPQQEAAHSVGGPAVCSPPCRGDRPPPCRFDIVSVVLGDGGGKPEIMLHKGAFSWDTGKPRRSVEERFSGPAFLAAREIENGVRSASKPQAMQAGVILTAMYLAHLTACA